MFSGKSNYFDIDKFHLKLFLVYLIKLAKNSLLGAKIFESITSLTFSLTTFSKGNIL